MSKVVLKKGGVLELHRWNKPILDVSDSPFSFLFYNCELEENVTLRDLFLLIRDYKTIADLILGGYASEYIEEAFTESKKVVDEDDKLVYLELYFDLGNDYGDLETDFGGYHFPQFHGRSLVEKYAIEFTPVNEIINLPLKLKTDCPIYDKNHKQINSYTNLEFTLGHILQGVFYEISFLGSPTDRTFKSEELKELSKRIKDGTEKLYSLNEVNERFKEKFGVDFSSFTS